MSEEVATIKAIPVQQYAGVRFSGKTAAKMAEEHRIMNGSLQATRGNNAPINLYSGNDTEYHFKHDIVDLVVGDTVVCDCTTGLAVGVVSSLNGEAGSSTRWLVQRVDMLAHQNRMERVAKRLAIRKLMDDRRKQLEDEALYRMMAERDPEMAKLIVQYYEEA
jgi:hypothetical protein